MHYADGMLLWLLACTSDPPTPAETSPLEPVRIGPAEGLEVVPWGEGAAIGFVVDDGTSRVAQVARLDPDGTLSAPVDLPAEDPVSGLARKPQLAADGTRFLAVWSTGDPRESTVVLADAPSPDGPFTTTLIATGAPDAGVTFVDQPDVHLSPTGEAWVGFKAEVDHPTVELRIAREASSWVPTPVSPSGGEPCECCPHVLRFFPDGDAWLLLRGNEANIREIHEARLAVSDPPQPAADLSLGHTTQVSHTGWWVQGCPFDGPSGVALDDQRRVVSWVDPTSGSSRAWVAHSVDDGRTWSDARPVFGDDARLDQQPGFVALPDGRLALAVDDHWTGTSVVVGPAEAWLGDGSLVDHPDTEVLTTTEPLWDAVIAPFGDGVLLVGVDEEGVAWAEVL